MTALIVIDDPRLRRRVRDQLQDRGMQVTIAANVAEATLAIAKRFFLVVIVDLALPDGSGLDVLEVLGTSGATAHVIVLSESMSELDQSEALHRGADDFVVKPFFLKELVARVLAVRRRRHSESDTFVQLGRCAIDLRTRRVTRAGQVVELTAKEFDLLAYLAVRPGLVFSRAELLAAVWHSAPEWQQATTVTEHVRRLRGKIEDDPAHPTIVATVRGAGYRLDLPIAADAVPPVAGPPPDPGVIVHVDGRIVFADAAAGDLLAVADGSALVGRHLFDLIASTSQAAAAERLADTNAGRPRRSEIMQLQRSDGDQVTVEVASTTSDWHGTGARRVVLSRLSDAPSRLRGLVTGILADVADAVIITDLNFHVRSWNAAAERIYGWSEDAVLGRHLFDIPQLVGDTDQYAQVSEDLARTGRWNGTLVQTARDGSTVNILGSSTVLRDEDGEPVGVVSVNRLAEVAGEVRVLEADPGLVARVRQGIVDDEFVVYYQPIVDLAGGHVLTLEALVRWEHPDRGTLAPAEFLDAAERSGSIVELGELVLEKACRQAAAWRRRGADIRLSVNVSTRQLAHPGLTDRFTDILRRTGFDPVYLWLEVTETALVEELEKASQVLRTLAEIGVGVSIDDFGTGWASLTYLQSFPVHALKIDRSFVAGAGRDHTSMAIVRSILSLSDELELIVIGEGVETEEQHDLLKAMGCTLGQGYFYGHPTPAAEVPIERAGRVPEPAVGELSVGAPDLHAGLANRRVLDRVLPRASTGSIVMLDLDHFRQVNDEHGHAAGDDILRAFGRILDTQVRAQDTTCRIGGEEFALVLADLDVAAAVALVERLREAWLAASPRPVTFSAGVAAVTPDGGTAALLAADRALHRAKELGRNRTERAPSLAAWPR